MSSAIRLLNIGRITHEKCCSYNEIVNKSVMGFWNISHGQDINKHPRVTKIDCHIQFYHNKISLRCIGKTLLNYESWGLYLHCPMIKLSLFSFQIRKWYLITYLLPELQHKYIKPRHGIDTKLVYSRATKINT